MSARSLIALFVGALIALQAGYCACAPSPVISAVNQGKESIKSQAADEQWAPLANLALAPAGAPAAQQANLGGLINSIKQQPSVKTANNAEKLKRGLSNFMNQLNPASFFVPAPAQQQQQQVAKGELPAPKQMAASKTQTSAETAAIVNGDATADVLINRPNRLSQTRPIGGPLRWG